MNETAVTDLFQAALDHQRAGRLDDAERLYRKAARLAPGNPEIHYNLGLVLMRLGRSEDAVGSWRSAVELHPGYVAALNNLGIALAGLNRMEEAERSLRQALERGEEHPASHNNLGIVLAEAGRLDEAVAHYRRAIALMPGYADAHGNLGIARQQQGFIDEAIACYRAAIAASPDFAKAHFNLGLALLLDGQFTEGWREHEWRWRGGARHLQPRPLPQPLWTGGDPAGKTILLHAEQGFGDTLQFARYATPLARAGARVIVEAPSPLTRLLRTLPGAAAVIAAGDPLPRFDFHLPLLSAPWALGTDMASIPAELPYLAAEPAAVGAWTARLASYPGRKVGLVWSGDPRPHDARANAIDRRRSMAMERLRPLLALPGITFVSLQKGSPAQQREDLPASLRPLDFAGELADFADTAALVAALDLVISVDTAVAHLAGALGKPVWILSRFDGCWRWLRERDDSPWYPTARLFRQRAPGDWDEVVERVVRALGDPSLRSG